MRVHKPIVMFNFFFSVLVRKHDVVDKTNTFFLVVKIRRRHQRRVVKATVGRESSYRTRPTYGSPYNSSRLIRNSRAKTLFVSYVVCHGRHVNRNGVICDDVDAWNRTKRQTILSRDTTRGRGYKISVGLREMTFKITSTRDITQTCQGFEFFFFFCFFITLITFTTYARFEFFAFVAWRTGTSDEDKQHCSPCAVSSRRET